MNYLLILVTLFLSPLVGNAQSGLNVFDNSYIHDVRLTFNDTTFWDSLVSDYNAVYGAGQVDFSQRKYRLTNTIEIDGIVLDSVGFRLKGLSSGFVAGSNRRHFKIDFGEFKDWKFDGLRKLNLSNTFNDGTMLRDALVFDWFRDMGIPSPRTSYFKLYLNNEYWGLYLAIEQVDKEFLEDNFVLSTGNLYKPFHRNGLNWYGPDWFMYEDTLELRTNENSTVHTELFEFLELINTSSDSEFVEEINNVLDVDKFLTHLAVDYMVSNFDSPFIQGRNYYLYADEFNGKIITIPWDYNFSFNSDLDLFFDVTTVQFDTIPKNVLKGRIRDIPEMRQLYLEKNCEMGWIYSSDYFDSRIDEKINLIKDDILQEPFYSNWMPHNELSLNSKVNQLKNYISTNANRVSLDFGEKGFYCVLGMDAQEEEFLKITPNPVLDVLTIDSEGIFDQLVVMNSLGEIVIERPNVFEGNQSIDCSFLNQGIYFLELKSEERIVRGKFQKL